MGITRLYAEHARLSEMQFTSELTTGEATLLKRTRQQIDDWPVGQPMTLTDVATATKETPRV